MKWLSHVGKQWLYGAFILCLTALTPVSAQNFKSGSFTTSDGVKLNYLEAGSGPVMVLIPGWSQTAIQFKHQLAGLSDKYRVIALDMRGHGDSDKPKHGYRIHRLSTDVREFLVGKNLKNVVLGGHSMGCSVIWGYWELYGGDRISKLILIDQMPMITGNPAWSEQEKQDAGPIFDGKSLYDTMNALAGPDGEKVTEGFINGMFTKDFSREEVKWAIDQNLKFPRKHAAELLFDHSTNDWRDIIPRINVPTLLIGAKTSLVSWKSVQWEGSVIKGSRVEIFEENEGGNHMMFHENPTKFNRLVKEFAAK